MTKRTKLEGLIQRKGEAERPAAVEAQRPAAVPVDTAPPEAPEKPEKRAIGQTLRLNPKAWSQLKMLAFEQAATREEHVAAHDLLVEAVNDLFRKYGKPPIA